MIEFLTAIGTTTGLAGMILLLMSLFGLLITRARNPAVTVLSVIVAIVGLLCVLQSMEVINIVLPKIV